MKRALSFVTGLTCVIWLIILMIIVGGWTRLLGAGLSIPDWKPLVGAIPPLSSQAWMRAFQDYQQTSQYQLQNFSISLSEFQWLYWWEWGHRQLGRLIGLVYICVLGAGFYNHTLPRAWRSTALVLLILGGVQGLIGWLMVKSGLTDAVRVSHIRLALHLGCALIVLAGLVWMRQGILRGDVPRIPKLSVGLGLTLLVYLQILWGALVAGFAAGHIYNTFPLIDGHLIPPHLGADGFFTDHLRLQWVHRVLGCILLVTGLYALTKPMLRRVGTGLLIQFCLGIVTLLTVAPVEYPWIASLHQMMGVWVFIMAVMTIL